MAYLTGEPRVDVREIDLSQLITSSSSNVGVVVGQAERGPVMKKIFITDDDDYKNILGSTDTSKYGFMAPTALTFLEGSNQLYVTRVVGTGAAFSGIVVAPCTETDGQDVVLAVSADVQYPIQKVLSNSPIKYSTIEICTGTTESDVTAVATLDENGDIVMNEGQTNTIVGRYVYANNTITITSCSFANATVIVAKYKYLSNASTVATGLKDAEMTSEDYDFTDTYPNDVIAIYADNQGAWGNKLKVSISNFDTRDSTFDITVFETVDNIDLSREVYHVSRVEQLDGNGNQLYLEDVINGNSLYLRVRDLKKDDPSLMPSSMTKVKLTGAADGAAPTLSQIAEGWDLYEDWESIDVDILMDCGNVDETDTTVQNKIKAISETRQDCVGVFSVPQEDTAMSPMTTCTDWRMNLQGINSSYVGLYTPWVRARDTFKNKVIDIPPIGYVGAIMAKLSDTYYAPAGLEQGVLSSTLYPVVGLTEEYKSGHRSALYDSGINVLKPYPGIGYVVWGQKTEQTKASALDRFNVRRSLNTIKRAIRKAYMYKLFKNNDVWTRTSLYNAVVEYMNTRKAAFYDYKVICDETNNTPEVIDRNHIVLTIMVKPVKTAEYGILNVVITSTGVEFSSVEGSITI